MKLGKKRLEFLVFLCYTIITRQEKKEALNRFKKRVEKPASTEAASLKRRDDEAGNEAGIYCRRGGGGGGAATAYMSPPTAEEENLRVNLMVVS